MILTLTPIASPVSANPQVTIKENLNVAGRFAQTLLKKLPECVDTNPVKMAFSIAKVIIEIKNVCYRVCILGTG
jgi:hypothetical protein